MTSEQILEIIKVVLVLCFLTVSLIVGLFFFFKFAYPEYVKSENKALQEKKLQYQQEARQQRKLIKAHSKASYMLTSQLEKLEEEVKQKKQEIENLQSELKAANEEIGRLKKQLRELENG